MQIYSVKIWLRDGYCRRWFYENKILKKNSFFYFGSYYVFGIFSNSLFASNRKLVFVNPQWSVYLDSPDRAKPYYHLHFYQKKNGGERHVYCLRLDNLQPCDGSGKNADKVPRKIMEKVMKREEVQILLKIYYPQLDQSWLKEIVKPLLIAGASILVVLVAVNIFTGPIDDVAAWAALAGAVNW